jgi:hypothetical protein
MVWAVLLGSCQLHVQARQRNLELWSRNTRGWLHISVASLNLDCDAMVNTATSAPHHQQDEHDRDKNYVATHRFTALLRGRVGGLGIRRRLDEIDYEISGRYRCERRRATGEEEGRREARNDHHVA